MPGEHNRGSLDNLLQGAKREKRNNQHEAAAVDGDIATDDPAEVSHPTMIKQEATVSINGLAICSTYNGEQQELVQQLASMREQYELKQQEVEVLQSQVQRLCTAINESASSSHSADSLDSDTQQLRLQLQQTTSELQHCRAQLHAALDSAQQQQALLASATASKAALERRTGTLKLLLAEHIRENVALIKGLSLCQGGLEAAHGQLQQIEQQRQAAEIRTPSRSSSIFSPAVQDSSSSPEHCEQLARQHQELMKQKQELQRQQRELAAAAEQVQDLQRLLALKEDSLAYANRHATLLEQQLDSVKEQLLEALAAKSCTAVPTIADMDSKGGDTLTAAGPAGGINTDAQQQEELQQLLQQHQDDMAESSLTAALSFAGGIPIARGGSSLSSSPAPSNSLLAAAIGRAGSGLAAALAAAAGGDAPSSSAAINVNNGSSSSTSSPKISEQLVSLSPFAKARGFMAQREENQVARLKEELRERERQVKDLTATVARAEGQLHGLQTVLSARTGQCNRLDSEVRQVERQLRQVQAAAAAEAEALHRQLVMLSDRVVDLEAQLGDAHQREQHTQLELAVVRAKLGQVLEALLQDAEALQRHDPKQHAALAQDAPAALADVSATYSSVMPGADTCSAAMAAAQAVLSSSSAAALAVLGSQGASSSSSSSITAGFKLLSGGNAGTGMSQGGAGGAGGAGDGTPTAGSSGGGLFGGGNKLLGALLGRRNSASMQEVAGGIERTISGSSSGGASSTTVRILGDLPHGSGAAPVPKGPLAANASQLGGSVLSRVPSDASGLAAILGPGQPAGSSNSRPLTPHQQQLSGAAQQLVARVPDSAVPSGGLMNTADIDAIEEPAQLSNGAGHAACATAAAGNGAVFGRPSYEVGAAAVVVKVKASLPDPVRDKLDAVTDLLQKLGHDNDKVQQ